MSLPPLSRLYAPRTVASAVASGVVELIPFHRTRGWSRAAIIAAPGLGYAGVVAWVMTRRGEGEQAQGVSQLSVPGSAGDQGTRPKVTPQLVGVTTTMGALLSGSSALGLAIDGAVERFLVRRGVRRPLLIMGAMGLVVGWAMEYFGVDSDDDAGTAQAEAAAPQAEGNDAQASQRGAGKHGDDRGMLPGSFRAQSAQESPRGS